MKNRKNNSAIFLLGSAILLAGILLADNFKQISQQANPQNLQPFAAPNLKAKIFSLPGHGCCWDPSHPSLLADYLTAFFDPDIYITNIGTSTSGPGKIKLEWFDLFTCSNQTAEVNVPPIKAKEYTVVTTGHALYLAKKANGIRITLTYSNQTGKILTYTRVVTTCPDNY